MKIVAENLNEYMKLSPVSPLEYEELINNLILRDDRDVAIEELKKMRPYLRKVWNKPEYQVSTEKLEKYYKLWPNDFKPLT